MLSFKVHSPEQEIFDEKYQQKNVRVFVKRDDLIHPFISGNKWRKLKFHLQKAFELQCSTICTFGGAWSNHLLATACAGAQFGLKTMAFVRGEDVINPVLTMCQLYGMKLQFVSRAEYADKESIKKSVSKEDIFVIDEGGYGKLALDGCGEIWDELQSEYDHIFVACGTGSTIAGLQKGKLDRSIKTTIHGIPVLKNGDFILNEITSLNVSTDEIQLHTDYHFGGYAKTKLPLLNFIKKFVSATGIMIEPTYTGKLFFAVEDLIDQDFFKPESKILVIHTGGLTGILGQYEKFTF